MAHTTDQQQLVNEGSGMRLDHVGISVADLDSMLDWYGQALEMTSTGHFEVQPLELRGAFLVHPGGLVLELLERAGSAALPAPATQPEALLRRGYGHLCLRVTDVDQLHATLLRHGAIEKMAPCPSPQPGVRMSFVADPEGNFIELIDRKEPLA
ncbi:VOC family protein [Glutamicibacter uratoxydans]|uniref:VOC family protein n=1 Tax=Glutamicibacter uratoxydans TaxID=43667 RepID=UPI003D6EBE2E